MTQDADGGRVDRPVGRNPKGVVAVLISADGREVAHASAFGMTAPAGFKPREFQEMRARRDLALAVVRELSAPLLANAVDEYIAEQIMRAMCNNGARIAILPIGWED